MGNCKKSAALGINYSTATNRLKKNLFFNLVKDSGQNFCFRCGAEIESVLDLSVDHKEPWLGDVSKFWDLENIAYSHIICNSTHGSSLAERKAWDHGDYGYRVKKCRCKICKEAHDRYR